MGTQKNSLHETVLFEHPKPMFKLMDKKKNHNFNFNSFDDGSVYHKRLITRLEGFISSLEPKAHG